MNKYVCKIATKDEIIEKFNYEIEKHPNDNRWSIWKNEALQWYKQGKIIVYIGILNGEIITEATAIIDKTAVQNAGEKMDDDELVNSTMAYLSAFRTKAEYEGKGYFSRLYKYMENDLKGKGYKRLSLGVEPKEVRNMKIYFNWGFDRFIKTAYETYPPKNDYVDEESILVNYYYKDLEDVAKIYKLKYNKSTKKGGGKKMRKIVFYRCNECGKIECVIDGENKELMCCGKPMEELKPNTVDAAVEKHVPVYEEDGDMIKVKVGDVEHPMTEEHYIMWIAYFDNSKVFLKRLNPTDKPEAEFKKTDLFEIYAFCNLHGLWKK
ncbi:MAG: GNAT family N-acetyltransferase [Clostridia bacterium]|nr:GNAT family N-acetyltransferase [Clostridia bacterium]